MTPPTLRDRVYVVIFEHGTRAGRAFDVALLIAVLVSIIAVILESVVAFQADHGTALRVIEWTCTVLFAVEYGLRIYSARQRRAYVLSFFGVIDLLAILPTILSLQWAGAQSLLVVRVFRMLRVFRILKLARFHGEAHALRIALATSLPKITVFLGTVIATIVLVGAAMYLIEGPANGFDDIPHSMYWAVVTLTTVGYGDIAPATPLGRGLAACLMVLGYGIIAVPTGIVSVELARASSRDRAARTCPGCGVGGHLSDAAFCRRCGVALDGQDVTRDR
ncbi:MAG: ion transporter [Kofleriaceae bacterium]